MCDTPRYTTWIVRYGVCKDCDSNLVICQSILHDYWWYCSNKMCKNHHPGEQLFDMEECSFAKKELE